MRCSGQYNRYFPLDPFVNLPEKQVITMHEFVPVEQLERSRFFTEYLIPWDAIYNLGVDLRDGDRLYARLRVTRGRTPAISPPPRSASSSRWCRILTSRCARMQPLMPPRWSAPSTRTRWTT